jgi:hypothetical protein
MPVSQADLEDLVARRDIQQVLVRYCTALDRADLAMMETVYWPDGIDIHGIFSGEAAEFVPFIVDGIKRWFEVAVHAISNVSINVGGDQAASEAYLYSVCIVPQEQAQDIFGDSYLARHGAGALDPGRHLFQMGGRYLDRFERRNGEWRIIQRQVVLDWNDNWPSTDLPKQIFAAPSRRAEWGRGDAFYDFIRSA